MTPIGKNAPIAPIALSVQIAMIAPIETNVLNAQSGPTLSGRPGTRFAANARESHAGYCSQCAKLDG